MATLRPFFYKLPQTIVRVFRGRNLLWHAGAIVLTYALVMSGFDRYYFEHTRNALFFMIGIPAAFLGFLIPIFTPIILFVFGLLARRQKLLELAYALGQSAALGFAVSALYKAVSGRVHPPLFGNSTGALTDISREFHFGILQGGVFWGWPSSHTAVAFALAATIITLCPSKRVQVGAGLLALYIGLGVSVTIHWFSDFAAGAILGTLVGMVVGSAFRRGRIESLDK